MKLTYCFFTAQYLPTVGGVERYTNSLAKKLISAGHEVIVVTSQKKGTENFEMQGGIKVFRVPTLQFASNRLPFALPLLKWHKIKSILKSENIDFVVIQTRLYFLSFLGAKFAHKNNIRSILIDHSTAHIISKGVLGYFCSIYEHIIIALIKKYNKEFYGVSKSCTKWLEHFGIKTQKVLYNAVEPQLLQETAQKAMRDFETDEDFLSDLIMNSETKHSNTQLLLQSKKDIKAIVYSGRFVEEKGVLQLIKAFEKIKAQHKNAVLLLGGGGPQLEEIKAILPQNSYLLGMLPYEKNLAFMKSAHIFCLPSLAEGFATTVLEAVALKTFVITTNVGGSPELITSDRHGLIIENNSVKTIEKALSYALNNDDMRNMACENAYERLNEHFTWQKVFEKLQAIAEEKL